MAHFYVRNSLNYNKTVKINISFVSGYNISANDGAPRWFLELATTQTSSSGTKIAPQYINNITDKFKLDDLIANAVSNIASQIDWAPFVEDTRPPYIDKVTPNILDVITPIESNVDIVIKDNMPSAGIDLSEALITMEVNDLVFDITSECIIEGTPFEYNIHWEPPHRCYEYYGDR